MRRFAIVPKESKVALEFSVVATEASARWVELWQDSVVDAAQVPFEESLAKSEAGAFQTLRRFRSLMMRCFCFVQKDVYSFGQWLDGFRESHDDTGVKALFGCCCGCRE